MLRDRLLFLYPRAWRERYGEEFRALVGHRPLRAGEIIDILSGAIDARLSSDVRRATPPPRVLQTEGSHMQLKALLACERTQGGVTPRDGLIGAGVMIGVSLLLELLSAAVAANGFPATAAFVNDLVFPASLTLSLPFWVMKGAPWKGQVAIVATTLLLLVGLGIFLPGH